MRFGTSFTWSGAASANAALYASENWAGSNTGSTPFHQIVINTDNVNSTGNVSGFNINHQFGGTNCVGNRAAFAANTFLITTSNNLTQGASYSSLSCNTRVQVNDNGTAPTQSASRGQVQTANLIAQATSGATNFYQISCIEFDTSMATGSSAWQKVGVAIVQLGSDQVQGSGVDTALSISNAPGAVGWRLGIGFNRPDGRWPFVAGATIMGCEGGVGGAVTNCIDFSPCTISGSLIKGPGFNVSGTGAVTGTSHGFSNGVTITSGTGSPAGVVAAPQGSLFLRTDGAAGTTLYVKESGGVGNTGWTAK